MRTCVRVIVCVLLPRFQLTVAAAAAGTARDALLQKPVALAPEPGGSQLVGEVSLAAEAFGVHPGMRLGEALARCPRLTLVPPDPAGVADSWERLLVRLESIGAAVEPERPGLVCFDGRGLAATAWGDRGGAGCRPSRLAGPGPLWGRALALCGRGRGNSGAGAPAGDRRPSDDAGERRLLSGRYRARGRPCSSASFPRAAAGCVTARPPRVGRSSRGARAARHRGRWASWHRCHPPRSPTASGRRDCMPSSWRAAATARCGRGRRASSCASRSSCPRRHPALQLERGLGLLIDRRARPARAAGPDAALGRAVGGAGRAWRHVARAGRLPRGARRPVRMRLALVPHLQLMPAPAEELRLAVERFGPPASDQRALLEDPAAARSARLREAIRQTRAAAGPDAALRVLDGRSATPASPSAARCWRRSRDERAHARP